MNRILLLVVAVYVAGPASMLAQTPAEQQSVEAGRKALDRYRDFPWYDDQKDAIKRIDVYPPKDVKARQSQWQAKPSNFSFPPWLATVLEVFGWLLLGLAIVFVIYLLTKAFVTDGWRTGGSSADEDALRGDVDRIEALPFQLKASQTDLLAEARRHYEAGDYGQAIIYLYSYQLVQLDRHHLIRLTKGKTNRQYLREVRPRRPLFDLMFRSMITFEDVFFGHHALSRDRFEACWRELDDFHQHLEQAVAA